MFEAIHPFNDGNGRTGRVSHLVDKGTAQRQAASRYLHDLADLGVLREMPFGKEKLFIHPKLMQLLSRDNNPFQPCA
jgi:Fic family protein